MTDVNSLEDVDECIPCFWYSKKRTVSDMDEDDDNDDDDELEDHSWITWFCEKRGGKFLCRVDEDFIKDEFNLFGLSKMVPHYDNAIHTILDEELPLKDEQDTDELKHSAEFLYGLIHARYILTTKGLFAMFEKYKKGDFGYCPRALCENQHCLPVGKSDAPNKGVIIIYCPKCQDIYHTIDKNKLDGAYIGTTFPHLFCMKFPEYQPPKPTKSYVPRVFGFKLRMD